MFIVLAFSLTCSSAVPFSLLELIIQNGPLYRGLRDVGFCSKQIFKQICYLLDYVGCIHDEFHMLALCLIS